MVAYAEKKSEKLHQCQQCYRRFYSRDALTRHIRQYHIERKLHKCKFCQKDFIREKNKFLHERNCDQRPCCSSETTATQSTSQVGGSGTINESDPPVLTQSSLKHTAEKFQKQFNREDKNNLYLRFKEALREFIHILVDKIKSKSIKWYLSLNVEFCGATNPLKRTDPPVTFRTEVFTSITEYDLEEMANLGYEQIVDDIENFQRNGSGWVLDNLVTLDLGEILILVSRHIL